MDKPFLETLINDRAIEGILASLIDHKRELDRAGLTKPTTAVILSRQEALVLIRFFIEAGYKPDHTAKLNTADIFTLVTGLN